MKERAAARSGFGSWTNAWGMRTRTPCGMESQLKRRSTTRGEKLLLGVGKVYFGTQGHDVQPCSQKTSPLARSLAWDLESQFCELGGGFWNGVW